MLTPIQAQLILILDYVMYTITKTTTHPVNIQHARIKCMPSSHVTILDLTMLGNKNIIRHVLPQL